MTKRALIGPALLLVTLTVACGPQASTREATPADTATGTPTAVIEAIRTSTATPQPTAATAAATVTPIPTHQPQPVQADLIPVPPDRDLYDLATRLRLGVSDAIPRIASPLPEALAKGTEVTWRVSRAEGNIIVNAKVQHVSENAYWIFEEGFTPDLALLKQVATAFESDTWPSVTGSLGNVWTPGVDGDDRIVVFHGLLRPGVAGYFSGADEYPISVYPESNQREVIYISANLLVLGSTGYMSTLAHELAHAVHWAADVGEESWVNEGIAEVASGLAGIPPDSVNAYLRKPGTSLTQWAPDIFEASPNYGAAALFFEFIMAHYGGMDALRRIVSHPLDGMGSVGAALQEAGFDADGTDVFADWIVANLVDDEAGEYSHPGRSLISPLTLSTSLSGTNVGAVKPFGVNYHRLENWNGDISLEFSGDATAQVFPAAPRSGEKCWWSNAGDSIDATLTRSVDLRGVDDATLRFWAWYAIEEDWDYAYVMVSTDSGSTWKILPTQHTSSHDPNGTAFGPGLTGLSGGWVQDEADLGAYAGSVVLLRFEYITDDAIHDRGACFDDFSIPEIGWQDNTDTISDWDSEGFALTTGSLPVEFLVQAIYDSDDSPADVTRIHVLNNGSATIQLPPPTESEVVTIAVSIVTPNVTGAPSYSFRLLTRQPS